VPRVPLLSGSRVVVANADEDAVLLTPAPPQAPIADVGAAVRDALRFPLAGPPLSELVPRGGRATIVVEPFALPLPGALHDPRQQAVAAAVAELERHGVPDERQTILVAGGLTRRAGRREREWLVSPDLARAFRGDVLVHDVEDPDLVAVDSSPFRVSRALVDTDVVVVVGAAETVCDGGPAALLRAGDRETMRGEGADSLLETGASQTWQRGVALERALARRVPVVGASLTLNNPIVTGALLGYPYDPAALDRLAQSPLRRVYGILPGAVRRSVIRTFPRELTAAAAFAGPPAVAHAEALLRAIDARAARLDGQLDALVVGIPPTTPHIPRESPNPLLAAYLGLGLALRLWRDAFPLVDGGTAILVHPFDRRFAHPTQTPYRAFFHALRSGARDPLDLEQAERGALGDERALAEYRAGRTCHPLLPYADWAGCQPALGRLGAVIVAGCRDATVARQLGFVPSATLGAALQMAHGRAGGPPRVGYLLSPPFFPLLVNPD
jgi:hypothetical protein